MILTQTRAQADTKPVRVCSTKCYQGPSIFIVFISSVSHQVSVVSQKPENKLVIILSEPKILYHVLLWLSWSLYFILPRWAETPQASRTSSGSPTRSASSGSLSWSHSNYIALQVNTKFLETLAEKSKQHEQLEAELGCSSQENLNILSSTANSAQGNINSLGISPSSRSHISLKFRICEILSFGSSSVRLRPTCTNYMRHVILKHALSHNSLFCLLKMRKASGIMK